MMQCPDPAPQPFLIPGHAYLFKVAHGWRAQQLWSEFAAYRIGALAGVDVPPCYVAINSKTKEVGALIEFFFGYPGQDTKRLVHGIDIMRRLKIGSDTGRAHGVRANVLIARAFKVGTEVAWWAKTLTFDALIGNTDRHTENWGLLFDLRPGEKPIVSMAPAFDNGTSLAYEISDQALEDATADARITDYIGRGRHHCSWDLEETNGAAHIELCARYLMARTIGVGVRSQPANHRARNKSAGHSWENSAAVPMPVPPTCFGGRGGRDGGQPQGGRGGQSQKCFPH
jgi:hypothetical protein